jgi:Holliday junction resolvase RusA-like endonuclease
MILCDCEYVGRLPRINRKYGATSIRGKARVYVIKQYRQGVEEMAAAFISRLDPITEPVNIHVEISLWKRIDSDAPIKAIFDALEKAGVLKNDKQIRDFVVKREYHLRDDDDIVRVTIQRECDQLVTRRENGN